jgi:glucuronate isomerase
MIMSPGFLDDDFLLGNAYARDLYHTHAAPLPVIDYHCHLPADEIATDRRFENLTQIWLAGDHYKWRAMRACGVPERFITGDATDLEKFEQWATVVPKTLRNPLYHWTHLELRRPFGVTGRLLAPGTARGIWEECNAKLADPEFSVRGILERMNVEVVCTSDDPLDTLEHHERMASDRTLRVRVLPTFRPDRALAVERPEEFNAFAGGLEEATGRAAGTYPEFIEALSLRHEFFHARGCRISDHGIGSIPGAEFTRADVDSAFRALRKGTVPAPSRALELKAALLHDMALMDWEKGWAQQFHVGALRDVNTRMRRSLGPNAGCDTIGDTELAGPLAAFLDSLDADDRLARTVLYNLNPRDNELFAAMAGSFQDGRIPGKIQYGPAWWFLDQADGMRRQMEALSSLGLLSMFIGMVTDSRSFLSYPRHEYFRRVLCGLLGDDVARGLLPADMPSLGGMVRDICYFNARRYFRFPDRPSPEPGGMHR